MNPKSIRRFQGLRQSSPLVLVSAITAFAVGSASAAIFSWNGSSNSVWSNSANWDSASVAPTGVDTVGTNHRVNIKGGSTNEAVYDSSLGNSTYGGANIKGIVIGNPGDATLRITGGKLTTQGTGGGVDGVDVVGNTSGTANLIIDGGEFQGCVPGTYLGIGGGPSSNFTINSGTATVTLLYLNATNASASLNGGLLVADRVWQSGDWVNSTVTFDNGTLKAGANAYATFISALDFLYVKEGGATIDSNGKNITIVAPMEEDPVSPGGGLTKNGEGTLTLGGVSTISGVVTVNAGGLGVKAGLNSWTPSSFTHSGDKLNIDLGIFDEFNPPAIDVTALTLNSNIEVNISGSSIPVTSEIIILDYGTKSGTGSLTLNISSLPSNMVATLGHNTTEGYYYLNVTSASATSFIWSAGTGNWDTATANWNSGADFYAEPAVVTFPNLTGGGTVTITENVAPVSIAISNASGNPYTFAGTGLITGATGITKTGTGIAYFNGAAHTYSGAVAINAGALFKQVADATTGNITVAADNVSFVLDGGITDGAGQTLHISGRGATSANYFFTNSAVQRGALQAHNGASTWQGNIVLASNSTSVLNRIGVQNGASLTLTGLISESVVGAGLVFRAGIFGDDITLAGAGSYSYTGQTQIFSNGASIILGADNKLPPASILYFGSNGSTIFDLNGNDQECAGLTGNATTTTASITNNGSGPSTLTTTPPAATNAYFPSLIEDGSNTVSLVKNGDGTQTIAGTNTYTGTTTINGGRLEIQEGQSATGDVIINGGNLKLSFARTLSFGVNMSIASGAFFYLDGSTQTLGKLEGAGTIDHTIAATGVDTLTIGANDATSTFNGVIQQSQPRTYALRKIGTGTFTLTGLNTYTGNTTIEDGTLSVAQSNFADTSTVTIGTAEASPAVLHLPNTGTDIVAALIIDGVTQPGDGAVYDSANSNGAITGNGKIQVGTAPGGYSSWAAVNAGGQTADLDFDNDGVSNGVEFFMGETGSGFTTSPTSFANKKATWTNGGNIPSGDYGTQFWIQTSTNLVNWTDVLSNDLNLENLSGAVSYTLTGSGKEFMRLKVTPN